MGGPHQRTSAKQLLRECPPGCHGRRLSRQVWYLLRYDRRPGVRLSRCRGLVVPYRSRLASRAVGGGTDAVMIRVVLPPHLRALAHVTGDIEVAVEGPVTLRSVLDALENQYPM